MTTITRFTKEQLIEKAKENVEFFRERLDLLPQSQPMALSLRLAEIALASFTAEPIGITDRSEIECLKRGEMANVMPPDYKGVDAGDEVFVYTAPPAPESVPDDLAKAFISAIEKEQDRLFGEDYLMDSKDCVDVIREEAQRLNACRAAMLQGSQPVSNRDELPEEKGASLQLRNLIRQRHAEWSDKTFGNVGPVGPLKHLSKEALEAAAEPDDLSEWADMQFLLWDAQRRAGISDGEITAAMEEKLKVNMARHWPEPKDGEPRLHIKEAGNYPVIGIDLAAGPDRTVEVRYFAPPDYVMVPKCLTAENGAKSVMIGEFSETKFINCPECFGDDECETCDGSGRIEILVPVSWTNIKAIWAKGVEHFAAAPKQETL